MTNATISFDLETYDNMDFMEGTFKLPGQDWQVFVTIRTDTIEPVIKAAKWHSGVTGVNLLVPRLSKMNADIVRVVLGQYFGVDRWDVVRGPDSLTLR